MEAYLRPLVSRRLYTTIIRHGNKEVLSISQSYSITGASPSDCFCVMSRTLVRGVLPLCGDAVGIFCSPSRLRQYKQDLALNDS